MQVVADSTYFPAAADIVRGRTPLSAQDRNLMGWVAKKFGVTVVAVLADSKWHHDDDRMRVTVWLESEAEAKLFRDASGNFDKAKQKAIGIRVLSELPGDAPLPFVVSSSFTAEARAEAFAHFKPSDTERLKSELANPLITAVRIWYAAVVFLETDAQAAQFAESPERDGWTEIIWRAIHARDEFGVVPRETFEIRLDSEENFQTHFAGSSYYYWL